MLISDIYHIVSRKAMINDGDQDIAALKNENKITIPPNESRKDPPASKKCCNQ